MISYLQIDRLTKSFGDLVLFENITFGVAQGQKIGLIAKNGSGKTTLLNIIAGKEDYDSGEVVFRKDLRVGYLEQSPSYPEDLTVLQACFYSTNETVQLIAAYEEALAQEDHARLEELLSRMDSLKAWDYEQRAKQILGELKIHNFNQRIKELSGGQLKRVALANVLITDPELIILDEPTNHLDLEMTEWLEEYLSRSTISILMVTHDRYFLDRVCNLILELDNHTIYSYRGNFRYYMEKRQERIDATRAEIERANNLYRRELEWMRRQPQARGHKARYREEAFYDLEAKAKQRMEERQMRLKSKNVYIGSKIFECQYVSKAFDEKVILKDFYYNFQRFEKMGIVGNNGTGKSTFIKMLLGETGPDSGQFDVGDTVRFGYFSQDDMKFNDQQRVIDVISDIAEYIDYGGGKHITAGQLLQHFLFTPEQQYDYVYKLSGGERRKLYLCTVLMRNPNFLVLDEPTNDLDIQTLEVLEEYLQDFPGCVIIVSHDRFFMDKIVDHLLVFRGNGEIKDFPGNYTQFREWESLKPKAESADKPNTTSEKKEKREFVGEQRRKKTYKEKCEFERLEKEIAALEQEQKAIEEELCSGTLSIEQLTEKSKRLPIVKENLEEKEMRWLELSEID